MSRPARSIVLTEKGKQAIDKKPLKVVPLLDLPWRPDDKDKKDE